MEIIVTGGRDYEDKARVFQVLDDLIVRPTLIIQGGATGADSLAKLWAQTRNVPWKTYFADWNWKTYFADWKAYGPSAGPRRNKIMLLAHPGAKVLVFPGDRGTKNCRETAESLGYDVEVFK